MIKRIFFIILFFIITPLISQETGTVTIDTVPVDKKEKMISVLVEAMALAGSNTHTPFWFYANQRGRIRPSTRAMGLAAVQYNTLFNNGSELELKGGAIYQDGGTKNIFLDELYAAYRYKGIEAAIGIKQRPELLSGLSAVGGDILWSRNARAMPGVEVKTLQPIPVFKWLSLDASLAHYQLEDNRFVEGAKIHHKTFFFNFKLNKEQQLSAGLKHYVQWGGVSPEFGQQAEGFKDFIYIFLGKNGGNTANDQINASGNHLASYELTYTLKKENYQLQLYHQTLFDDRSGRELNNFPDGVWGVYFKPEKNKFISGMLYEYIQTVSQSGRNDPNSSQGQQSGQDNYFSNSIYRSGWTYFGQTIGLPFILPNENGIGIKNNRSYVHHFGIQGALGAIEYSFKSTYVKNKGTYALPYMPSEKAIYTLAAFGYTTQWGTLTLQGGADYSSYTKENFGVGVGYRYSF